MDTQKIIHSQYLAALAMLEQVIVKRPAAFWNAPGDQDIFWEYAKTSIWIGQGCILPDPNIGKIY